MIKLFLLGVIVLIYLHILIHFNVNPDNSIQLLHEISRENIENQIMLKLPFYFNGFTINNSDISMNNMKEFDKPYESITILEPYVKFFPNHKLYQIEKKKYLKLHENKECRNFYKITQGIMWFICIHPKYKLLFQKKDKQYVCDKTMIKNMKMNNDYIHIVLHKDSVLFLPNHWLLFGIAKEQCILEKIQYSTIMNQPCFYVDTI